MAWEVTKPSGEAATVVWLNGHIVKQLSKYLYAYAHRSVLLSTLASEGSFCSGY